MNVDVGDTANEISTLTLYVLEKIHNERTCSALVDRRAEFPARHSHLKGK